MHFLKLSLKNSNQLKKEGGNAKQGHFRIKNNIFVN